MAAANRRQVRVSARVFHSVERADVARRGTNPTPIVIETEPEVQIPRSPKIPEYTVSWQTLFDRAAAFEADEKTIRDRLAELRHD